MKSIAILALLGAVSAVHMNKKAPVRSGQPHWNEDPNSIPDPLKGKPYLTSTQARFIAENSTANMESREPTGDQWWHFNFGPYNTADAEYTERQRDQITHPDPNYPIYLQENNDDEDESDDDMEIEDDSMVLTNVQTGSLWRVIPDFGEKDPNIMEREKDIANGKKFSGWTNPLGWSDDGADDDLVV